MMFMAAAVSLLVGVAQPEEPKRVRYEDLPAAAQLGVRVDAVRRAWPAAPCVVIVPSASAYVEAIAAWSPAVRFPVLIDDGSPASREDIGRFVRGFGEARVFRWGEKVDRGVVGREAVDGAIRAVWGKRVPGEGEPPRVGTGEELLARWRAANVPRSGIVFAAEGDSGWTAALALAAGRAQPLAWVERPGGTIDGRMEGAAAAKFEADIESACEGTKLSWRALGDEIDAVTICISIPSRVLADGAATLAMTDVVGRLASEGGGNRKRWAWAGQIAGSEARCAYVAMCALFLEPKAAWMFDGYPANEPWSKFSMKPGIEYLERIGVMSESHRAPKGTEAAWRRRASSVVDAGLVLVNTKGMANEFFLEPGRCVPADVPELRVPAILHLVHSWSALSPFDRETLGGRWLERGVYAYLGSVDEPYLNAFVPSSLFVGRMVSKYPFGAAARIDDGPAWKLAIHGDPLITLGLSVPRVREEVPLEEKRAVKEDLAERLKSGDLAGGLRLLVLLGDDEGVAKLARGMLNERKEAITPDAAEDSILPLFRAAEYEAMGQMYALLTPESAQRGELLDALWHYGFRVLPSTKDAALVGLLHANIRGATRQRDAVELADAYAAVHGSDAAVKMLIEQREKLPGTESRHQIDMRIGQLRSGRR